MKKVVFVAALFVTTLFCSIVHAHMSFSVIDSEFSVYLNVHSYSEPYWGAHSSVNSPTPITHELVGDDGSVFSASASYNHNYMTLNLDPQGGYSLLLVANTILYFQPNFSGQGPTIDFTHGGSVYDESFVSVLDTTANDWLFSTGQYMSDEDYTFTHADWNPEHVYRLYIDLNLQGGNPWNSGSREITTNMVFTSVPEPATMILLASALVGLVGFRRKFKK